MLCWYCHFWLKSWHLALSIAPCNLVVARFFPLINLQEEFLNVLKKKILYSDPRESAHPTNSYTYTLIEANNIYFNCRMFAFGKHKSWTQHFIVRINFVFSRILAFWFGDCVVIYVVDDVLPGWPQHFELRCKSKIGRSYTGVDRRMQE